MDNTYNILSGASVSGTDNGLSFFTRGTVNNSGTITGGDTGVRGEAVGTVNNSGVISATGSFGLGISIPGTGVANNFGSISGGSIGVELQNGEVTNASTGTITGGTMGLGREYAVGCRSRRPSSNWRMNCIPDQSTVPLQYNLSRRVVRIIAIS
jgi:hypothetical protein